MRAMQAYLECAWKRQPGTACVCLSLSEQSCTGAQALVAWSLQRSFGEGELSLVAEEASNDLR